MSVHFDRASALFPVKPLLAFWLLFPATLCAQTLYEADLNSGNIFMFTPAGVSSTFAFGLTQPVSLIFDMSGNLYEADGTGNQILKFTPAGVQSTFASGLSDPQALAFDRAGNLYEGDFLSNNIFKFSSTGVPSTFASGLNGPAGLAFDSAGNLFEADFKSGNILKFTPTGVPSTFASGLNGPVGLAFDTAGNLFEADFNSGNIFKFTPTGLRSTFASGLNKPAGLAFDAFGNLYEADFGSGNILKFTPADVPSTFASGLNGPYGLAFPPANAMDGFFQVRYASNLIQGDAVINITNTGAFSNAVLTPGQMFGGVNQNNINGDICVNIYTFAADEQEVACCSCLVTPNALWSASVKTALLNSTLTPAVPNEVVIKLISSAPSINPTTQTESCNPAALLNAGLGGLERGLLAWGSSLHAVPNVATGPTFQMAETPFANSTLSQSELERDVQECQFIQVLGSGQFGICKGCSNVGLGATAK